MTRAIVTRAKQYIPMDKKDADDLVFKALANKDRRLILDALHDHPRATKDVCEVLPHLDRTTVMLHLRVLEEAELVIAQRKGRMRLNHLNVAPIQNVYNRWIRSYAAPAAELLTRLKKDLEGTETVSMSDKDS